MKVSKEKLNDFLDMIYNLYHSVKKENNDLKNKIKELEFISRTCGCECYEFLISLKSPINNRK